MNDYINEYLLWLKDNMNARSIKEDVTVITSPFVDRHNDSIEIYIHKRDNSMTISDEGYTISDLEAYGFSFESPTRKQKFEILLNGFGVRVDDNGALFVEANKSDFPQKKHALMQSILAVNDMYNMNKSAIASLFVEDCQAYFDKNKIIYLPQISISGKSGLYHKYDFVLPKTDKIPYERFIRPVNQLNKQYVESILFAWNETKAVRKDEPQLFVITNDREKQPLVKYTSALDEYGILSLPFTKLDEHRDKLVS